MSGVDIAGAVAELVADLRGMNLRASVDLDTVNPPAVWAVVEELDQFTGSSAQARVALYAVVADQRESLALVALDGLLTALFEALDLLDLPYAVEPVRAQRIATANGPELPAWRVVTQLTV